MQKRICMSCGKPAKNHDRVKIIADGKLYFICEDCMNTNRDAMLADANHPAWKYYNAVAIALGMKGRTDD